MSALLLLLAASLAWPASGPDAIAAGWRRLTWPALNAELSSVPLVAAGEQHDRAAHHRLQALLVESLAEKPGLVVGLEMVPAELQGPLDAFLSGATPEPEFAAWWKSVWGFDYALYKPIFDAARAKGVPVRGLNAPRELVRAVARRGLEGLAPEERARLPAKIEESEHPAYRRYVRESLSGHSKGTRTALTALLHESWVSSARELPEPVLRRMEQAMAVWNETMGENAAKLAAGGARVLVIAGQGHMLWGAGVPESARRRGVPAAAVVLPYAPDGELELADYWLLGD